MTSLRPNLVKRIARLPKPASVADALQPLFEAISNAIHSTQARFDREVSEKGRVQVTIKTDRRKDNVSAIVEDNGLGLNEDNWDAFITTDTDNKIAIGGKGVGRLLWLDCFPLVRIDSVYKDGEAFKRRQFEFVLELNDQIKNLKFDDYEDARDSYFLAEFKGLRSNGYHERWPGRGSFIFQHLTSHFLPTFIGKRCPQIYVHVGDESRVYPGAINEIVYRREDIEKIETEEFGELKFTMMECDKVASADLKGSHFMHFIAHDRTVHSHSIDSKLGLKYFGDSENLVFHAILTGAFLDKNVNQERTKFQFEDAVLERMVNDVCWSYVEQFLSEPMAKLLGEQRVKIESITATYPSVAFGDVEELQEKVPSGELKEDALYGHLSRERFRRDERQAEKIRSVLTRLKNDDIDPSMFANAIKDAGKAIEEAEQKSLAEYIVRRKVVLDFIELLLDKVRDQGGDASYQREDVLHSFICPMKVSTITGAGKKVEPASSHDLWIVDERLTFAQYFSSDVDFASLSQAATSEDRPDLLIFDYVHGLRQKKDPSKVLLVEFKRPGRKGYDDDENPQLQVERYVRRLQSGELTDVRGRPITLDQNTIFYCFIIADIIGKMADWTFTWQRTADGRGRVLRPSDGFRGSIELIGWDDLLKDARERNQAFFDKAGITGKSFFSAD
ncbi:ATP-binding protein [Hansschlegelia sp. KR7-227]|uniref:ATP-binding protein n=1 Tax=Hansschlegelia sp. KR7-227 TaxID=3400914 RepID=UPI003C016290